MLDGGVVTTSRMKSALASQLCGVDLPSSYFSMSNSARDIFFRNQSLDGKPCISRGQYLSIKEMVYEERKFGMDLEYVDSVLYYLSRLKTDGHEIHVVTLRSEAGQKIAQEWCDERGFKPKFIVTENRRIESWQFEGFDVFFGVKVSQLVPLVGHVKNLFILSKKSDKNPKFRSVRTWEMFYRAIPYIPPIKKR